MMNTVGMAHTRILLTAAFSIALCSASATAQSEHDATVRALVDKLDSDDYAQRKIATSSLSSMEGFDRAALAEVLAGGELSFEQRERLEGIALTMFQREPRAGLGVQFDLEREVMGAGISRALEGFDAARVLQPLDVVVAVDGQRIGGPNDLRFAIISRAPGETLPLTIVRDGEQLEVAPVLGAYNNLGNAAPLRITDLLIAWRMWLDRLGMTDSGEQAIEARTDTRSVWAGRPPEPSRATLGGSMRDLASYAGVRSQTGFNPNMREVQVRVFQNGVEIDPQTGQIRDPARIRAELIDERMAMLMVRIEVIGAAMLDAEPERKADLEAELTKLQAELEGWQRQRLEIAKP